MRICGKGESLKTPEIVPSTFSHKVASGKSSWVLVVPQWANGGRNMTMLSRIPPGKIHLFPSHTLLSTYHSLSWVFVCVSVSPVTSESPAGGEWAISIFHSPRGLTERPINIPEVDRTPLVRLNTRVLWGPPPWIWPPGSGRIVSHTQGPCICTSALKRSLARCTRIHSPGPATSWAAPELLWGVKVEMRWVSVKASSTPWHPAYTSVCQINHWTSPSLVLSENRPINPKLSWSRTQKRSAMAFWSMKLLPWKGTSVEASDMGKHTARDLTSYKASWLKSPRHTDLTVCLATRSHRANLMCFSFWTPGRQWQCCRQAGCTCSGRLRFPSISPRTSAGPVRGCELAAQTHLQQCWGVSGLWSGCGWLGSVWSLWRMVGGLPGTLRAASG